MSRNGYIKPLYQNPAHTVGVVRVLEDGKPKLKKLGGYWNKELLQQAMEALDLFDNRDMEVYVLEDESGAILLMRSPLNKQSDVYIAVAGKTEAQS